MYVAKRIGGSLYSIPKLMKTKTLEFKDDVIGLHNLEHFAARHGKKFDYMNTLLMVDNYLPNFKMEDQLAKLSEKRIEENLSQIIEDIYRAEKQINPGQRSWKNYLQHLSRPDQKFL